MIRNFIDKRKSRKYLYPIYYQRRNCRVCGRLFSSSNIKFIFEYDKNGDKYLKYANLSCSNGCDLHNGEKIILLNWYIDEESAAVEFDNWLNDNCPVLEGGLP